MTLATMQKGGTRRVGFIMAAVIALLLVLVPWQSASANAPGSLYSYNFAGTTGTVANSAEVNTAVPLTLLGDWTATAAGVFFTGNTVDAQSVGYAKSASGSTLTVPATQSVGVSILFRYQAPSSGQCFSDSPNLTQIGKFAANITQVKLQLSNCGKSATQVYPQCRMAGASTASSVLPVMGTQSLVDGELYIVQCAKTPDPVSGKPTLELKTTKVDTINGNQVTIDSFQIAKTGNMNSTQYLSVANQYPLKAQTSNTDQFVGEVLKLAYCKGADLSAAQTCLEAEVTP